MTRLLASTICALLLLLPISATAQTSPPRLEMGGSIGATRVFRAEDQSFGTVVSPGIGIEWRALPRLGLAFEASRATGFEPRVVTCAIVQAVACSGSAREGVLAVTLMSATAAWYFAGNASVQPYVIGGLDVVASKSVASVTFASTGNPVTIVEQNNGRDTGMGITAGIGIRVPIGRRVAVRPEWRIYDGAILGRENLAAMRTSVALAYSW